ncbi:MAG: hypothetical protein ABIP79_04760 [Chitinophagaceae bacterium]
MKRIPILAIATIFLLSCGDNTTKKEKPEVIDKALPYDSAVQESVIDTIQAIPKTIDTSINNDIKKILSNIDRYLISKAKLTPRITGDGFSEATVTVKNILQHITIQNAFMEVNILTADDKQYRTDFYTLENIEPGSVKIIQIPESSRGVKIRSHIIKLTSDSLTNGETMMVGQNYIKN